MGSSQSKSKEEAVKIIPSLPAFDINEELHCIWREPGRKEHLTDKIKQKKAEGMLPPDQKITQKLIAKEHILYWSTIPPSDRLAKLLAHPLLTRKDNDEINRVIEQQKSQQIKASVILTAASSVIYWVFLSRKDSFYRFFNKKSSHWLMNGTKKVLGLYLTWMAWLVILNSHYESSMPNKLHDMGFFSKYRVAYDKRAY